MPYSNLNPDQRTLEVLIQALQANRAWALDYYKARPGILKLYDSILQILELNHAEEHFKQP